MRKEIDPFTGLELSEIGPTAPQRANRFLEQAPILTPTIENTGIDPLPPVPADQPERWSFGQRLLYGLLGPSDATLAKEGNEGKLQARNRRRREAGDLAASAWKNPGASFMGPVSGSGGSALESIGKIIRLLGG